jgi:ankyrin repeat protein
MMPRARNARGKKGRRNMESKYTCPLHVSFAQRARRILFGCFYLVSCATVPLAALWPAGDPHAQTTAMNLAAQRGNIAEMKALLRGGVDVNCADETGITPLMAAARGGQVAAVRKLLAVGARIDARAPVLGTPLILAIVNVQHDVMRELIARGADVDRADATGQTPLGCARNAGDDQAVRILIAAGAVAEGHFNALPAGERSWKSGADIRTPHGTPASKAARSVLPAPPPPASQRPEAGASVHARQ